MKAQQALEYTYTGIIRLIEIATDKGMYHTVIADIDHRHRQKLLEDGYFISELMQQGGTDKHIYYKISWLDAGSLNSQVALPN